MRYLVKAKVKPGQEKVLLEAIDSGRLGQGSVAGDEYLEDMPEGAVYATASAPGLDSLEQLIGVRKTAS